MKMEIINDSHLLKEASKKLVGALKDKKTDEGIIFDINVSFEEALRNAMIHGNQLNPQKKVMVDVDMQETFVKICVEDEGEGFDPGGISDPTIEENVLKESGRGVYLIKHLMDEVNFDKGGRRLTMTKYFNRKRA